MCKKMSRLCSGILAVMLLLSACGADKGAGKKAEAVNPVADYTSHSVSGTLHKVNVTESNRPFVENGKSEYKVIAGTSESSKIAADYLVRYVEKATGCLLEYAEANQYKADGKFIVFNDPGLFAQAGLTMPAEELQTYGYYIKSVGDNLFLATSHDDGNRYAVISFLKNVLGMEIYGEDQFVFNKDGATLPDMEIIERPDLGNILMGNWRDTYSKDAIYLMGYSNYKTQFLTINGHDNHTSLLYMPVSTYFGSHPDWYSSLKDQLCYTAHGNEEELTAMVDEAARLLLENIMANPDVKSGQFTMADTWTACTCDACEASNAKYGTRAAAVVQFTNRVSRKIQAELQRWADMEGTPKREFTLYFFAYHMYLEPPVIKNPDGSYIPVDETVVCDKDVGVCYAPISAYYTHNFYEKENQESADMMSAWSTLSSKMYYWLYETNFHSYLHPFDSWDSNVETLRYCYENNADIIFFQGQHNQSCSTGFTSLKIYVDSMAAMNLNNNYQDMVNDFFTHYYGDAAEPMLQYFEELQAWMRHLAEMYPVEYTGRISGEVLSGEKYWPRELLLRWQGLIDQAYAALAASNVKGEAYAALVKHVKMESIFLRYELISSYSGIYSAETLLDMKQSFKDDCKELGITAEKEQRDINELYRDWGI